MAVKVYPTNGVSYGMTYTVTAADATANYVEFEIAGDVKSYPIVASIRVVDATNVNVSLADAVITYPADGKVRLADGSATFVVTAGYKISILIQRDNASVTY